MRNACDENLNLLPFFKDVGDKFPVHLRKYFAGMIDGDGTIVTHKNNGALRCGLELAEDAASCIAQIADIFDLTVRRYTRHGERYKNHKPTLKIEISGAKVKFFLLGIYPYLLEKKERCRQLLISKGCPKDIFEEPDMKDRKFSYVYLAGYTDAEGSVTMSRFKSRNTYFFRYALISNDMEHLRFIKSKLMEDGFEFRKDEIKTYKNIKKTEGRNPDKWKPTMVLCLKGGPAEHTRLYEKIIPFMTMTKKIKRMKDTINYDLIARMIKRKKQKLEEKKEELHEKDRPRYEEQSEEEYLKHCERFFKGWDDDKVE